MEEVNPDCDDIEGLKRKLIEEQASPSHDQNSQEENSTIISVSATLRKHYGEVSVRGLIVSISELYKMISQTTISCSSCGFGQTIAHNPPIHNPLKLKSVCIKCDQGECVYEHSYRNAVTIELQDTETFNDIERVHVIVFDDATVGINVGEQVIVKGSLNILQRHTRSKWFTFVYADLIKYETREVLKLTQNDKEAIKRFTETNDRKMGISIIDRLTSMLAPNVIGYNYVKKGLLICAVSSGRDLRQTRRRINAILIGGPGLAKTTLLREIVKIVPNSRLESGQSSSGKSLTAIVAREEDSYSLRIGAIPLSREAICAINEMNRMSFADQDDLLDPMEEGKFTINKYGIHAKIEASTTIIASANPISSEWNHEDKIDLNEIPVLRQLLDRFDMLFVLRTVRKEDFIREYAYRKSEFDDRIQPNYNAYLRKHILYAKSYFPDPILTDEAKFMINEYYISMATNSGTPRIRETLLRTAKGIAMLKLKNQVDEDDARETMEFYNILLQQYRQVVCISANPKDLIYSECVKILKESRLPFALTELMKNASERNEQVRHYMGGKYSIQDNWKVKTVRKMLLNNSNIQQVNDKPIVLSWIDRTMEDGLNQPVSEILSDVSDVSDVILERPKSKFDLGTTDVTNNIGLISSDKSYASHKVIDFPPKCYHCDYSQHKNKTEYNKHCVINHPKKPGYPGPADMKELGIISQGMTWEVI